jgi:polyphosphate kinase 2 (PPK2 family)
MLIQLRVESRCDKPAVVPINLADIERGAPFAGDFPAALSALQERLSRVQTAQIVHRRRAVIVLEGPEGAGKKSVLKCLGAGFDPCHCNVHWITPDRRHSSEGHWLARFWNCLPSAGNTAIFLHSWYGRVLEDHVMGLVSDKEWKRGFDEINEFEAQQQDYGTLLIKLYFHATDKVLDERIAARAADPWRQHLLGPVGLRTVDGREVYRQALAQMFKQTDTRWAPWVGVDANDEQSARIAALTIIAGALEKAIPMEPPERNEPAVRFSASPSARLSPA